MMVLSIYTFHYDRLHVFIYQILDSSNFSFVILDLSEQSRKEDPAYIWSPPKIVGSTS